MIELHYVATPNGLKVALLLEELALPYQVKSYDSFTGEHLNADFGKINPNNRLPAIIDHAPMEEGAPLSVFESERPAVKAMEKRVDLAIPDEYKQMRSVLSESEWSNLFGDRQHAASVTSSAH